MTKRIFSLLLALLLLLPLSLAQVTAASANEAKIEGVTLHVGATLEARFYISAPENSLEVGVSIGDTRIKGVPGEDGRWVVSFAGISSVDMGTVYEVVPYHFVTKRVEGDPYRFSVQDYAMRLLGREDTAAETRAALIALLNFGAACQTGAESYVHNLPNEYLSEADKIVPEGAYESHFTFEGVGGVEGGYEDTMLSIVFVDTLMFKVSANITEAHDGVLTLEIADNPAFENSRAYEMKKDTKTGLYETTTDGLYLNALSRVYYLRINRGERLGKTFTYSVESYCYEILREDTEVETSDFKKRFAHAMMALSRALNVM